MFDVLTNPCKAVNFANCKQKKFHKAFFLIYGVLFAVHILPKGRGYLTKVDLSHKRISVPTPKQFDFESKLLTI